MNDEHITIPRFKDWTKPTTLLEAVERCLAHARMEEKWSLGSWFIINDTSMYIDECDLVASSAKVTKWIEGQTCTDVKACSAGIVAIETLDGAALYQYLLHSEELESEFLQNDPICWGTMQLVAQAFSEEFADEEDEYQRYRFGNDPVGRIVHHNDNNYSVSEGGVPEARHEHYNRIVRCFERAVEIAKSTEDKG